MPSAEFTEAAIPYMVSVGVATTPPELRTETAFSSAWSSCTWTRGKGGGGGSGREWGEHVARCNRHECYHSDYSGHTYMYDRFTRREE